MIYICLLISSLLCISLKVLLWRLKVLLLMNNILFLRNALLVFASLHILIGVFVYGVLACYWSVIGVCNSLLYAFISKCFSFCVFSFSQCVNIQWILLGTVALDLHGDTNHNIKVNWNKIYKVNSNSRGNNYSILHTQWCL